MRRLLLLLALLPILAWGLLATDTGLGLAARLAARFVPGLEIEGVSGPLPARLSLARLRLADEQGVWLEIDNASLELNWRALFETHAHLTKLTLGRLSLARLPTGEASTAPPSLPRLPVAISIDAIAAPRIELGEALLGQPATLALAGSAALQTAALTASLALHRLDQPGEARLELALNGETLTAQIALHEPPGGLVGTLAGQPELGFDAQMSLAGPATGADWRAQASLGAAQAALQGSLSLTPDGTLAATAQGNLRPGPLLPAALRPLATQITTSLSLRRAADGALALNDLSLRLPAGTLTGGRLALDPTQRITGHASITPAPAENFAPLLPEGLGWQRMAIDLELSGSLAAPEARLHASITAPSLPAPQANAMLGETLTLDAHYASGIIDARAAAERLALTLRGTIAEPFALAFTGQARDPPGFIGQITAEGALRGSLAAPQASLILRSDSLSAQGRSAEAVTLTASLTPSQATIQASGRFDRKPFTLALTAAGDARAVRLENLAANWSGLSLSGQGSGALPAGPFTGALRLEAPDLSPLGAGITGRLTAALEARALPGLTGPAAQGVTLRLNGQALGIGAFRPSVTAEANGSLDAMDFRLAATAPQGGLNLAGRFRQAEETRISLTPLDARAGEDALRLAAPALRRSAADGAITLDATRMLGRRGGSLVVQGRIAGGQVTGRAELAALPLAPLSAGLVTGTASGSITASGPTAAPLAEAALRIEALRPTGPGLAVLPAAQITANARWQGQALRADARLTAGPGVQLTLEASQPRGLGAEAPFEAALRGQLDLGLLSRPFLDARGDRLTGRAQLNLQASGTPARPLLAGEAAFSEGSYINPALGARLDGIALRLGASGQRLVLQNLTARTAGGGTLSGEGWLEPLGPAIPAEFRLRAAAARPITGPYGEAVLDADLRLIGPLANGGSLSGRLDIRRAELRLPDHFAGRIPSLGQVREVGPLPPGRRPTSPARAMPSRPALPMALQLTIAAPRAVFLRGRGVEAELGGEITIAGTLATPAPQGALRLRRGSINLVGRQLQFSRGLISFDAGTFNPSLDFLASARSRSNTVNLTIKGDPTAPEVTLTAEPELPQDEALARLLFDRETSRLSPFELASIAQALAQLSGVAPRGGGVLERLRALAGLDRLGVAGDGAGGARVETGRYIAPGVYFGLRQGTGGGAPGVGVQVEITPRLRLEGETSTGPAGDRVGLTWEYEY